LSDLLKHLPKDIRMAFVLIQHLEPRHKSILSEILTRQTALPVRQAKNNSAVEPGHVYVIPPNSYMGISGGKLKITARTKDKTGKYLPVDFFLTSLARDQGKYAIGIILSGTGSDGTRGIRAVKEKGGATFAQNEETSKYYGMPSSALAGGSVDFVLAPELMAEKLIKLSKGETEGVPGGKWECPSEEEVLEDILGFLRDATRVDFIHYKRTTLCRRILRRKSLLGLKSLRAYHAHLLKNPSEAQYLYRDILIPVTEFFRDPKAFLVLKEKIFPALMEGRDPKSTLRIWVPACSSGQEVYSMAMALDEFFEKSRIKQAFLIFGTDLSEPLIEKARAGVFKEDVIGRLGGERLRRFFVKTEKGYRIARSIRDRCVFARQNLTNDPPLSNMDIVSCRNVLIYLDVFLQKKVLSTLHYALKPRGFLVLGTSESVSVQPDLFKVIDKRYKIYSKNATLTRRTAPYARIPWMGPESSQPGMKSVPKAAGMRKTKKHLPLAKKEDHAAREGGTREEKQTKNRARNIFQLEKELALIKKNLNAIIEEKDTVNEELKAANEEIQSSNEELQSMNEELETSKEELQSTNEELLTLNEELQDKNAELLQLNSDLSNVLSSINIPLIIVSNNLRITRFTPLARTVMNLIPTDVGRPLGDIKLNIDIPNLEEAILGVVESMIPRELEVRDREGRWYSMRIRPYRTLDNKIDGAVVSMIDINEIKRIQDELKDTLNYAKAIIETTRQPLLVLSNDLHVHSVNKAFLRVFKFQAPDIISKLFYDVAGWDSAGLRKLLEDVLPKKKSFENFEMEAGERIFRLNGFQLDLNGHTKPMILLAIEDITEHKRVEEALRRDKEKSRELSDLQMKLERAERLSDIGALASTVAHELRNPLSAIAVATENIKRKTVNPQLEQSFRNIHKKISESEQIISNLLFYSKLKPPHYEKVDLRDILKDCIDEMKKQDEKNVTIKMFEAAGTSMIEADPFQMKEIFSNILNNAYDAVLPGRGKIQARIFFKGTMIGVTIADNGPGIGKNDLKKVFNPFFTTKAKGTGLGLSICRQITDVHKGSIDIKSSPGQGISVTVLLPKSARKEE